MFRISSRQLIMLILFSGIISGVFVACAGHFFTRGGTSPEPVVLADPSVASEEQNNIEIYKAVGPGVVNITSKSYVEGWFGVFPQEGSGSGSIIDEKGHILTNYHVVQGASELVVQIENDKFPATVVGVDPDNDLAIIRVRAPGVQLTTVKLGKSTGLQVGQKVLAIGNPFGLQRTLTTGIISGLERPIRDPQSRRTIEGAIQTDASINPGNSGGPLLNAHGELIGINTAIYSPSGGSVGIGFAVPVDTANKIIPEIIAKGYVARPSLGLRAWPLNQQAAYQLGLSIKEGLIVSEVLRGSGAATAGIRPAVMRESMFGGVVLQQLGDIILSVNGVKTVALDDLQKALKDKNPGDTIPVELYRQGQRITLTVRLMERPHTTE